MDADSDAVVDIGELELDGAGSVLEPEAECAFDYATGGLVRGRQRQSFQPEDWVVNGDGSEGFLEPRYTTARGTVAEVVEASAVCDRLLDGQPVQEVVGPRRSGRT